MKGPSGAAGPTHAAGALTQFEEHEALVLHAARAVLQEEYLRPLERRSAEFAAVADSWQ